MPKIKFAVSYMATDFDKLKAHWKKHSVLKKKGFYGTDTILREDTGGRISFYESDYRISDVKSIGSFPVRNPYGLFTAGNDLFFVSNSPGKEQGEMRLEQLVKVDLSSGTIEKIIESDRFHTLHSLSPFYLNDELYLLGNRPE